MLSKILLASTCDLLGGFYAFLKVIVYSSDALQQMSIMSIKRKLNTF